MKTKWEITYITENDYNNSFENTVEHSSGNINTGQTLSLDWRTVELPCSVQNSPFGLVPHELYKKDRIKDVLWMRDKYWLYRSTFSKVEVGEDEEALYQFLGIDYNYSIYLNGKKVLEQEGMFSLVEIPLQEMNDINEILVVIHPFSENRELPENTKARCTVGNGWDFAPKILSAGIWDDAEIIVRKKLRVTHVCVKTVLDNTERADVTVYIDLSEKVNIGYITVGLDGIKQSCPIVNTDKLAISMNIFSPTLWWPNGMGNPSLVELSILLKVEGRETEVFIQKVGLREIERIPCSGQGVEDIPLQLVINKQKVFIKGVNWLPLDVCIGSITEERYNVFLTQFRDANVNLVRVWGGGLKEKESFYNLCDEMGLMVLQEFPLACQNITRTERFFKILEQEVTSIIKRLNYHPSVVIWTGGNEHYHYWDNVDSGSAVMDSIRDKVKKQFNIVNEDTENREWRGGCNKYDEPSLALMGHLCNLLDGTRPYQITSGMEGEGEVHGIWTWNPAIGDHRYRDYDSLYAYWRNAEANFFSECSVSSIANMETIKHVTGEELPQIPSKEDPVWKLHHAFHAAWDELEDIWLDIPSTEKLFGKIENLEALVFANQWMQGEGARFLIEEIRRKMGKTCGIIWWGINEPWPGLAGNAMIDYFGRAKLGMEFMKNAYKPTILSLRYDHCVTRRFKPELWISNDRNTTFYGKYIVTVRNLKTEQEDLYEGNIECESYSSRYMKTLIPIRMYKGTHVVVECNLYEAGQDGAVHTNQYFFGSNEDEAPFNKIIDIVR